MRRLIDLLLRGQTWREWWIELLRFCTVGLSAFVVDVGLFNLLRFGPGELLHDRPLTAKVVSVAVSILVAWTGNRLWTFREKRRSAAHREAVMFVLVNIGGMLVAVGCLAFSHYVLRLTSPLADNISANGVGLVLGTAFRYVCYRYVVFTEDHTGGPAAEGTDPVASSSEGTSPDAGLPAAMPSRSPAPPVTVPLDDSRVLTGDRGPTPTPPPGGRGTRRLR